jgi:purine-binding chemotaxis protein CheW
MESAPRTEQTCIIVVEINQGGRKLNTGIIVDKVSEVLNIASECIEEPPTFGDSVNTEFILGLGKIGSSVKILLDIDQVLTAGEIENLAASALTANAA